MPISYTINRDTGYLRITCEGSITDHDILSARLSYFSDDNYEPGTPELIDLSQADFSGVTPAGIKTLASYASRIFEADKVQGVKIAFFAPSLSTVAYTNIYEKFSDESIEDIGIFATKEKAYEWLLRIDH